MYHEVIEASTSTSFDAAISERIWKMKYRLSQASGGTEAGIDETWRRVARAVAAVEPLDSRARREAELLAALDDFRLLPAGRILAGAGSDRDVTLYNTFVMRDVPDSIDGMCDTLKDAALTMRMGGGIGFDFSTVRPRGTPVAGTGALAGGPLGFMDVCDAMCRMLVEGSGRGAMMAALRCDHPDIEAFVDAKCAPARLRNFNLSVLITDPFMAAVEAGASWDLLWEGATIRTVSARALWDRIMQRTYEMAEPGVLFIDRMNDRNPINYLETVSATNSCAEQPLPANGACSLAHVNLARLVRRPFTADAALDMAELAQLVGVGVRLLDNVVDVSRFPLAEQKAEALSKRRIGLGVTGLADALAMLGIVYGSDQAVATAENWAQAIQNAAYRASAALAREKGPFPLYDADKHLAAPAVQALDAEVRAEIAQWGLRNALLTSIAPTGTTSMLAGNVSSGIEPIFATAYTRQVTQPDGSRSTEEVVDYAVARYRARFGAGAALPASFRTAMDLDPAAHVRMQAAFQRWTDAAISKTVNCPEDIGFDDFKEIYWLAYRSGCKGCTTYRPNAVTGSVLAA